MNNILKTFVISTVISLSSTSVLAEAGKNVDLKQLPDGSTITVEGTVESIDNARAFTLRYDTGTIPVQIESDESFTLAPGEKVAVDGKINKGIITGTHLKASSVDVQKGLVKTVGDAIDAHTDILVEGAQKYNNIKLLPDSGDVKISGTVSDVDSERKFTIEDATGKIDVDVKSAEAVSLNEGAQVTVVGYIDKAAFSKDIKASRVIVLSNGTPSAGK